MPGLNLLNLTIAKQGGNTEVVLKFVLPSCIVLSGLGPQWLLIGSKF